MQTQWDVIFLFVINSMQPALKTITATKRRRSRHRQRDVTSSRRFVASSWWCLLCPLRFASSPFGISPIGLVSHLFFAVKSKNFIVVSSGLAAIAGVSFAAIVFDFHFVVLLLSLCPAKSIKSIFIFCFCCVFIDFSNVTQVKSQVF